MPLVRCNADLGVKMDQMFSPQSGTVVLNHSALTHALLFFLLPKNKKRKSKRPLLVKFSNETISKQQVFCDIHSTILVTWVTFFSPDKSHDVRNHSNRLHYANQVIYIINQMITMGFHSATFTMGRTLGLCFRVLEESIWII